MNLPSKSQGNVLFPIFLKLDQLTTLVVGGGEVGLEKIQALLKNNPAAHIKLVAPDIKQEIIKLSQAFPNLHLIHRYFKQKDLIGVDVAILATANRQVNREIRTLTKKYGIITNVADTPDLCDFYLGSTVTKGDLKIGISTNGKSPTFAKRFREVLEESLPEDLNQLLENLKSIRDSLKGDFGYKVKKLNQITSVLRHKQNSNSNYK